MASIALAPASDLYGGVGIVAVTAGNLRPVHSLEVREVNRVWICKSAMAHDAGRAECGRFRDEDGLRFLYGVCTRDLNQRLQALDNVIRVFDGWIEGYGSPKEATRENHQISTDFTPMIREQLPDILRLSLQCPFADVRERCSLVLEDLQVRLNHNVLNNILLIITVISLYL